jgi:uncharacterized membrane protein
MDTHRKTWHQRHHESLSFKQRAADRIARVVGSWGYIIAQTVIVILWTILNIYGFVYRWDPYPFILLNLMFSLQATYAAPIIMMSQNRQNERDRAHADEDFRTNVEAKAEIEDLQRHLSRIEIEKLDRIITLLEKDKS